MIGKLNPEAFHWNPFKPKFIREINGDGKPIVKEEPMTWRDAAKVSLILMIANTFTLWLPNKPIPTCEAELYEFLYTTFIFLGQSFFTAFVSLTGLALLYSKKKETTP